MKGLTETQREEKRKYYAKNRERINEAKRKWREKNSEKQKEKAREYYSRPEVKERRKKYYSNPERLKHIREYKRRPEVKKKKLEYFSRYYQKPEVKERIKKYYQRPEVKERIKKYYQNPVLVAKKHNRMFQKRNQHAICKYLASKGPLFCKICEVYYSDRTENEWLLRTFCPCCHRKLSVKKRGLGRPT